METSKLEMLRKACLDVRCRTIRTIAGFGSGHIGGAMSIAEVLTYLYYAEMDADPADPQRKDRDRLVISKGHAGPAEYAVLSSKGYFPDEMLETLNQGGTRLPSHCDMTKTPGVDFTAGSLGQGISAAVGIALGQKIQKIDARTFCIVGDGESQEGEVWEAAETAGAWKLGNLIAFTDLNGQQLDDYTDNIIPMHDLKRRYETFGWDAYEIDGHDFEAIENAIESAKKVADRPHMIILRTQKSHGWIPGEGIRGNHSMPITKEAAEENIQKLIEREAL